MRGLNPSSYTIFLALIVLVVLAGAFFVYRLRRDVEEDACPVTDAELLRDFERAYYAGEMDEAEFRSVTAALTAKKSGIPRLPVKPQEAPMTEPHSTREIAEDSGDTAVEDDQARTD